MVDRRPFRVTGPAVISVSGGRTSGYMLWRILDAHDGKLPPDVIAIFCNTGREMPATLDFVDEMARRWAVHIQWLEYRRDPETKRRWAEPVSHNSASRNGEPFEMMLAEKQFLLPGPKLRFCTTELKIRPLEHWCSDEIGWRRWINLVGLRGDEMHRVVAAGHRNAEKKTRFRVSCPLAKTRMTKSDHVLPFWAAQPFDLGLAGDWEGNCDGCMMKRLSAIRRMLQDHPERMAWWAEQERRSTEQGYTHGRFRIDRDGYAEITDWVRRNPRLPMLEDELPDVFDVFADCEGGCGI
jgi:3'-phosphoadenosine 5'-phosphosulfate sulfotransferase (PAPS reductase)/FAD synthetase